MDDELVRLVWRRAGSCCEYCRLPHTFIPPPFESDHIIALKHRGPTIAANLALACSACNSFKGSDIAGLDPRTHKLTPLFNPRREKWGRHSRWNGPILEGRTPIGRVTVAVLHINDSFRVAHRARLIREDAFPPSP